MAVKSIVPMPDFSLRKADEFEGIPKDKPLNMVKELEERLPIIPKAEGIWKPFETKLHTEVNPPQDVALTPIDWEFHQRALLKSREAEVKHRFEVHTERERLFTALMDEKHLVQEGIRRYFFFKEV